MSLEKDIEREKDLEKVDVASIASNNVVLASTPSGRLREGWERITRKLLTWGVESRGKALLILPHQSSSFVGRDSTHSFGSTYR